MNNEEIMVTEEVMDVVVEPTRDAKVAKIARNVGIGALIAVGGYFLAKKVIVPFIKKHKAAKAEKDATYTMKDFDDMVNDEL